MMNNNFFFRILLASALIFGMTACGALPKDLNIFERKGGGGVDVGNLQLSAFDVPNTYAKLTLPKIYKGSVVGEQVIVADENGAVLATVEKIQGYEDEVRGGEALLAWAKKKYPNGEAALISNDGKEYVKVQSGESLLIFALVGKSEPIQMSLTKNLSEDVSSRVIADLLSGLTVEYPSTPEADQSWTYLTYDKSSFPTADSSDPIRINSREKCSNLDFGLCPYDFDLEVQRWSASADFPLVPKKKVKPIVRISFLKAEAIQLTADSQEEVDQIKIENDLLWLPQKNVRLSDVLSLFENVKFEQGNSVWDVKGDGLFIVRKKNWPLEDRIYLLRLKYNPENPDLVILGIKKIAYTPEDKIRKSMIFVEKNTFSVAGDGSITQKVYPNAGWGTSIGISLSKKALNENEFDLYFVKSIGFGLSNRPQEDSAVRIIPGGIWLTEVKFEDVKIQDFKGPLQNPNSFWRNKFGLSEGDVFLYLRVVNETKVQFYKIQVLEKNLKSVTLRSKLIAEKKFIEVFEREKISVDPETVQEEYDIRYFCSNSNDPFFIRSSSYVDAPISIFNLPLDRLIQIDIVDDVRGPFGGQLSLSKKGISAFVNTEVRYMRTPLRSASGEKHPALMGPDSKFPLSITSREAVRIKTPFMDAYVQLEVKEVEEDHFCTQAHGGKNYLTRYRVLEMDSFKLNRVLFP